jgi:hypothetical protein
MGFARAVHPARLVQRLLCPRTSRAAPSSKGRAAASSASPAAPLGLRPDDMVRAMVL